MTPVFNLAVGVASVSTKILDTLCLLEVTEAKLSTDVQTVSWLSAHTTLFPLSAALQLNVLATLANPVSTTANMGHNGICPHQMPH